MQKKSTKGENRSCMHIKQQGLKDARDRGKNDTQQDFVDIASYLYY